MSAFSKLVPEGKRACIELEKVTPWAKESWARSVRTLERAGLFPEIGLEQVFQMTRKTGADPDTIARQLVTAAAGVKDAGAKPKAAHEAAPVCHAVGQYIGPIEHHAHDCARLRGHGPPHRCGHPKCGAGW